MKLIFSLLLSLLSLQAQAISFQLLNDTFYNTDEQLTSSVVLMYQENDHWSFHLGQDIYTPKELTTLVPPPGERPYNAWLYMGATYQVEAENFDTLFTYTFDVGTRGPRALGDEIQNGSHDLIGIYNVKGWDSQTDNEYGNIFTFTAEHSLLDILIDSRKELTHFSTYLKTQTGTLLRNYTGGVSMTFGYNTPYYNTLINLPKDDTFYVFANFQASYIEKNSFLEGNTNYNVIKQKYVREYGIGVNWDIEDLRIRYTAIIRDKDFTTQIHNHKVSLIEIIVAF